MKRAAPQNRCGLSGLYIFLYQLIFIIWTAQAFGFYLIKESGFAKDSFFYAAVHEEASLPRATYASRFVAWQTALDRMLKN